jgi:hypothetical protein
MGIFEKIKKEKGFVEVQNPEKTETEETLDRRQKINKENIFRNNRGGFFIDQMIKIKSDSGEVESNWKIVDFISMDGKDCAILNKFNSDEGEIEDKVIPIEELKEVNPLN